jgi:hypothetical protein
MLREGNAPGPRRLSPDWRLEPHAVLVGRSNITDRRHGCWRTLDEAVTSTSELVEWSGGATGLDQWLPSYPSFRASWQTALGSCRRFLRPLYSFRTAGFPQYGWKPASSSCALPKPFRAAFDAGAVLRPFLAFSHPGIWNGGCTHRPLAQLGLSCPRLQACQRLKAAHRNLLSCAPARTERCRVRGNRLWF